jgi:nitroreductase
MNPPIDVLTDLIHRRRSIFPQDYTGREIPRPVVEQIVESANYAPTHRLTQPWRFTIFRGEGLGKLAAALAENYRTHTPPEAFVAAKHESLQSKVLQASCVIAINVELHPGKVPEWEEVAAVACAVQNMWLTATALQVGAYWSTPAHLDALDRLLGLTDAQKCLGLFYMGYHAAKARPAVRGPIAEKLTWVEA